MVYKLIWFSLQTDEEDVISETRKHKSHYFPMSTHQLKRSRNNKDSNDANSDAPTYNSQKPVNFLFSNENESMDDSTDEET